jgi:hypothetical protein
MYYLMEFLGFGALVVCWCLWELHVTNRALKDDEARKAHRASGPSGHAEGQHQPGER